ncbi:CCA tRNA nucleotidyltransferase [Stetteria hydrogenophila]
MSCGERGEVEEQVLKAIRPSRFQVRLLNRFYELVKSKLEACIEASGFKALIEAQGSFAKNTLLSDKWEVDVFILFEGVSDEWIHNESLKLVTRCLSGLPVIRRYAQHPYVTVVMNGLEADVVPTIRLEKPRPHAMGVERTPFHTRYVKSKLTPCLADEVRLLKSFLKGIGAYGAETHVGGFSGYLAELLVIKYGSFRGVLRAAARWNPEKRVYIDVEGVGDREYLEEKYKDSVVIVVDPVDPGRNAAAAVRLDKLALFILAARLYLEKPRKEFFHVYSGEQRGALKYRVDPSRLGVVLYKGALYSHPPESVWGRLYRSARLLAGELERMGFKVGRYWFHTDESSYGVIVVEVEEAELPPLEASRGPPAWTPRRSERFILKRLGEGMPVWVRDDGTLAAWKPRKVRSLGEAVAKASRSLPAPPGASVSYAGTLEGAGEPWRGIISREYLKSFPSWIASP